MACSASELSKHEQMTKMHARLECKHLTVAVAGRSLIVDLNLDIAPGSFVCVLGTNGAGKTLTLHTFAGLRAPAAGEITLCNSSLAELSRKQVSQRLGLLLQSQIDAFPLTVMDSALMGRHPHLELWQWASEYDRTIVRKALACFDVADLENRFVTTLSGGERERVALATLMVQDPTIWLLDEPMSHLDPHHQLDVFNTLQQQSASGRIVITTVHNPAMAMRYANQILLLYGDGAWEYGPAEQLLEPQRLERVYQTPFDYYRSDSSKQKVLLPA
jgi:iron complex transport system ATP-binding protein